MIPASRRRLLVGSVAAASLAALGVPARAAGLEGPIRFIVTFPPGGIGDIVTRLIATKMAASMGIAVLVENRPGASGRIGTMAVKRAPADGTTILLANTATMVTGPSVWKDVPYDPVKDFVPLSHVIEFGLALAVAPQVPVTDFKDYARWIAADPKNAVIGSPSIGGLGHFLALQVGRAVKVDVLHIGFKGSAPLTTDLMGSQIPAGIDTLDAQMRAKGTKILATLGAKRSPFLPDVPTLTELGYPEVQGTGWFGYFAAAGTPKPLVTQLSAEIAKAAHDPEVVERMKKISYIPTGTTAEEFAQIFKADRDRWGPIIKASGLTLDD
jgi:tripartite-type tricarboxylate transporter receptor subunit TctC